MATMRTLTFFQACLNKKELFTGTLNKNQNKINKKTKRCYACSMIVHTRADQLTPQLLMELFDILYTKC